MSGPEDPTEDELETEAIADDDALGLDYRGRGRPKLPPDQRRRSKLIISLTGDEMTTMIVSAAGTKDEKGRPTRVQEWARQVLLAATRKEGQ